MRLLHTKTHLFTQFLSSHTPRYAILSHRWEPPTSPYQELEFQDFETLIAQHGPAAIVNTKIGKFSHLARAHDFDWVWIDTCCIDKRSSAELTEAINSMYRWYKAAERCYVFFNDVLWYDDDIVASREVFVGSLWFTRGWTLQELLAPRALVCYDRNWVCFGDRDELADDIVRATGIGRGYLDGGVEKACTAEKMSWAAKRVTTREEDMAYCLLGLFGVNMPMLYGEGRNAFLRLQRKLIKTTNDESIFAWMDESIAVPHGMLAPWPSAFAKSGGMIATTDPEVAAVRRPYSLTNRGLELSTSFPLDHDEANVQTLVFGLNCEKQCAAEGEDRFFAIMLERWGNHWQRVHCNVECLRRSEIDTIFQSHDGEWKSGNPNNVKTIYVKQDKS